MLKPGGRLGVVAMAQRRSGSLMVRLYEWAHRRFPSTVDCRPIPIRALVEQSGFIVGRVEESSTWGLPVDIVVGIKMV